jgi:hypothetical protein
VSATTPPPRALGLGRGCALRPRGPHSVNYNTPLSTVSSAISTVPFNTVDTAATEQQRQEKTANLLRLDFTGLDYTGLDYTGLDYTGLDYTLSCTRRTQADWLAPEKAA